MIVSIFNAPGQTWLVATALIIILAATLRAKEGGLFSLRVTGELKGLAILLVVFGHIGYFLVNDHRFLAPLSNFSGVGVDLFMLLSGYGLAASALARPLGALEFFRRRFSKVYIPIFATLVVFLAVDAIFLQKTYPFWLTVKNFLGFFPQADLYNDINSPLWFITPLFFYYLSFPLLFWRRLPWASATVYALLGYWVAGLDLPPLFGYAWGVDNLYKLHHLAFPLGIFLAWLGASVFPRMLATAHDYQNKLFAFFIEYWRAMTLGISLLVLSYTLTHTGIGSDWRVEQNISLASTLAFLALFIAKRSESSFLHLAGLYSFEIYLIHWPILYRYDFLFNKLPAGPATILYLIIFIFIGYLYRRASKTISGRLSS